jgi:uncharacterized protein YdeI (YjbR/CyaY-like superfamily)
MKPTFFPTPADFRAWLEENHGQTSELLVGFYKKGSLKPSITWPESVDHALCFGWIDGVRKTVDEISYTIRFTPRKPTSIWSQVNIKRVHELTNMGLMHPAGLKAFERRDEKKSAIYSYEQRHSATFPQAFEKRFRANRKAWDFFQAHAPSYRRLITYWVTSAKREETQAKRLSILIEKSEAGTRLM